MPSITLPGCRPPKFDQTRLSHDKCSGAAACPGSTIPGHPDSVDVACPATMQADRQYSMIRVKNGVIPALRTGLTVTLPALPDASNIWPLPKYMVTCWPPPGP